MDKPDRGGLLRVYGDEAKVRMQLLTVARGYGSALSRQDRGRAKNPDERVVKINRVERQSLFAHVVENLSSRLSREIPLPVTNLWLVLVWVIKIQ